MSAAFLSQKPIVTLKTHVAGSNAAMLISESPNMSPIKIRPKARVETERALSEVRLEPIHSVFKQGEQHQTWLPLDSKASLQQPPTLIRNRVVTGDEFTSYDYDAPINFVRNSDRKSSQDSTTRITIPKNLYQTTEQKRSKLKSSSLDRDNLLEEVSVFRPPHRRVKELGSTTNFKQTAMDTSTSREEFMFTPQKYLHLHMTSNSFQKIPNLKKPSRDVNANPILDLSKINKILDKEEILLSTEYFEEVTSTLQMQGLKDCAKMQSSSLKKHETYQKALRETITRLPSANHQLKDLLRRLSQGFESSLSDLKHSVQETATQYRKEVNDLKFKLDQVSSEFKEFKVKNDIDRLFGQGLDQETCRTLLRQIQELNQETDWHRFDRDKVENQVGQGTNIRLQLDLISRDYDKHHQFTAQEAMVHNHTYYDAMKNVIQRNGPPLSVYEFRQQFQETNNEQLSATVQRTADVSKDFHDRQRKLVRSFGTQSETIAEIFDTLTHHVKYLTLEVTKYVAMNSDVTQQYKKLSTNHSDQTRELYEFKVKYSREQDITDNFSQREKLFKAELQALKKTLMDCQSREVTLDRELAFVRQQNHKLQEQLLQSEREIKTHQQQIKKIQRQNDLITKKLVQIGGQEVLQELIADISTSETEEEIMTKIQRGNQNSLRSGSSKSFRDGIQPDDFDQKQRRAAVIATQASRKAGSKQQGDDINSLGIKKNNSKQNESPGTRLPTKSPADRLKVNAGSEDTFFSDEQSVRPTDRTAHQTSVGSINNRSGLKNTNSQEPSKKVTFEQHKHAPVNFMSSGNNFIAADEDPITVQVKQKSSITKASDRGSSDYLVSHNEPKAKGLPGAGAKLQKPSAKTYKQPDVSSDNNYGSTAAISTNLKTNISHTNRKSKQRNGTASQSSQKDSEDTDSDSEHTSQVPTNQETQTDLEHMVQLACDMFLYELTQQERATHDQLMLKRIKDIVERILAKSRQANASVKGLVGAVLGCAKHKNAATFTDMHQNTVSQKRKSHHFSMGGNQINQQSALVVSQTGPQLDMRLSIESMKSKFQA